MCDHVDDCRNHGYSYCKTNGVCYALYFNTDSHHACYHMSGNGCDGPRFPPVHCDANGHVTDDWDHDHDHRTTSAPVTSTGSGVSSSTTTHSPTGSGSSSSTQSGVSTTTPQPTSGTTSRSQFLVGRTFCGQAMGGVAEVRVSITDAGHLNVALTVLMFQGSASNVAFALNADNSISYTVNDSLQAMFNNYNASPIGQRMPLQPDAISFSYTHDGGVDGISASLSGRSMTATEAQCAASS